MEQQASGNERKAKVIALVCLLVTVAIFMIMENKGMMGALTSGSSLRLQDTGTSIPFAFNDKPVAYTNNNFFYLATKDGCRGFRGTGETIWEESYTVSNPVIKGEGSYLAVSEPKAKNLYIFGEQGKLYEKQFEEPIVTFNVNKEGYCAVILQSGNDYSLQVFDPSGALVCPGKIEESNAYPLSIDLSADGRMFAITFLDTNDVYLGSKTVFYYIYKEDGDGIFSALNKPGELMAFTRFLPNNHVLYVTDLEIGCVAPETGKGDGSIAQWSIPLANKIQAITFTGNGFAFATGEGLPNMESLPEDMVYFYNFNGQKQGEYPVGKTVTYMSAKNSWVLVGAGRNFYAFSEKGNMQWQHSSTVDIQQMLFLDNESTVLSVTSSGANVMKRERVSSATEPLDQSQDTPTPAANSPAGTMEPEDLNGPATNNESPLEPEENSPNESEELQ